MSRPPVRRGAVLYLGLAAVVAVTALVWVAHTPAVLRWLPPCPLYRFTGLYCAGCGISRALTLLGNGHLWAAFRMNPLALLLLPAMALWLGRWAWLRRQGRAMGLPPAWLALGFAALVLAYTVARNLPWPPFSWLAPTLLG